MAHRDALEAKRPSNAKDWSVEDAKACIDGIRGFDEIMHRYGMCPCVDDSEPLCLICEDEREGGAA